MIPWGSRRGSMELDAHHWVPSFLTALNSMFPTPRCSLNTCPTISLMRSLSSWWTSESVSAGRSAAVYPVNASVLGLAYVMPPLRSVMTSIPGADSTIVLNFSSLWRSAISSLSRRWQYSFIESCVARSSSRVAAICWFDTSSSSLVCFRLEMSWMSATKYSTPPFSLMTGMVESSTLMIWASFLTYRFSRVWDSFSPARSF
ncbi:MAG: hypothetical protein A4E42_01390 [Methanoregulaceae archaeon PtaU1.Bin222]|nr:MAG: hypothetical protein A4E42_01390 [Methanoregulaceae archaeon PtaU1.Bin222]